MIEQTTGLSRVIDDLLRIIQQDGRHIERTLSRLDMLRELVIKRDEQGLRRLLDEIWTDAHDAQLNEQNRQIMREQLAGLLGCETQELTLTTLKSRVDEPAKTIIAQLQQQLKVLSQRLKKEYVLTVRMLSDCARINSSLLKIIFERGQTGLVCYDSDGTTGGKPDAAFMSARV